MDGRFVPLSRSREHRAVKQLTGGTAGSSDGHAETKERGNKEAEVAGPRDTYGEGRGTRKRTDTSGQDTAEENRRGSERRPVRRRRDIREISKPQQHKTHMYIHATPRAERF